MTTFSKELLVFGYIKGVKNLYVPVSIIFLVRYFVPEQEIWNEAYAREDIIATNDGKTIEKIADGGIALDCSYITGKQQTLRGRPAVYEWQIKILKNVQGEWSIGIMDSNMPKPFTQKVFETMPSGKMYTGFYLWSSNGILADSVFSDKPYRWKPVNVQDMDVMTIRFDCSQKYGKLSFLHTTQADDECDVCEDLGVAFTGIDLHKQWSICLILFSIHEKMEIQRFEQISNTEFLD